MKSWGRAPQSPDNEDLAGVPADEHRRVMDCGQVSLSAPRCPADERTGGLLALDDVVDFEHLWLTGSMPNSARIGTRRAANASKCSFESQTRLTFIVSPEFDELHGPIIALCAVSRSWVIPERWRKRVSLPRVG